MDYYCATKFTDLLVHVQSRLIYNCCKAYPERVDLEWLEANPGKLFHTPIMLQDRKLMLENKSCSSCHFGCYKYEEQGMHSARLSKRNQDRIIDPDAPVQNLQISLTTDCNLSCVYCSPEWSTAWHREIETHGDYKLEGHVIKNDNWSKIWSKMKQNSRGNGGKFFSLLLNEIKLAKDLRSITLLGGEPLLNNQLEDVIDHAKDKTITVITGLGVSDRRLEELLKKIKGTNIRFQISAESTGDYFEFIRHGVKWNDFERRVGMIDSNGHNIGFISTTSNLSMFDIHNFYRRYHGQYPIHINTMSERPFLEPHVLDEQSKEEFSKNTHLFGDKAEQLIKMISKTPSKLDRDNLKKYLTMLRDRGKINLTFFPKNFLDWCGIYQ